MAADGKEIFIQSLFPLRFSNFPTLAVHGVWKHTRPGTPARHEKICCYLVQLVWSYILAQGLLAGPGRPQLLKKTITQKRRKRAWQQLQWKIRKKK